MEEQSEKVAELFALLIQRIYCGTSVEVIARDRVIHEQHLVEKKARDGGTLLQLLSDVERANETSKDMRASFIS